MSLIEIRAQDAVLKRPLATSTLLGRHHVCTWRVPGPRIPLYWLELRWMRSWAWRTLVGDEDTRGPGKVLPGGWRALRSGDRIVGPGEVSVMLIADGPPEAFAVDETGARWVASDALDELLESRADGLWPTDAEGDVGRTGPLQDGQLFRWGGRVYRFHDGQSPNETVRGVANLASPSCELEVRRDGVLWSLEVVDGANSLSLAAEYVRVLVPYAEARRNDMPVGGWLELDAAHFRWQQLGGSAESDRSRIAQDRSRLCRALAKRGVASAAKLFETSRTPEGWLTRVSLEPRQLALVE